MSLSRAWSALHDFLASSEHQQSAAALHGLKSSRQQAGCEGPRRRTATAAQPPDFARRDGQREPRLRTAVPVVERLPVRRACARTTPLGDVTQRFGRTGQVHRGRPRSFAKAKALKIASGSIPVPRLVMPPRSASRSRCRAVRRHRAMLPQTSLLPSCSNPARGRPASGSGTEGQELCINGAAAAPTGAA